MREKGTIMPCWQECKLVQQLWKTLEIPQKFKTLEYDAAIPLLNIYVK